MLKNIYFEGCGRTLDISSSEGGLLIKNEQLLKTITLSLQMDSRSLDVFYRVSCHKIYLFKISVDLISDNIVTLGTIFVTKKELNKNDKYE